MTILKRVQLRESVKIMKSCVEEMDFKAHTLCHYQRETGFIK